MNIYEHLRCIKHINSEAHCVVWEDGKKTKPVYDKAHKGKRPTPKQCEAVLSEVQEAMVIEQEKLDEEALIKTEEANINRQQAINNLKTDGKLKYN